MAKTSKSNKEVQLEYSFDRLAPGKVARAYQLLVPEKIWTKTDGDNRLVKQAEGANGEISSDVCPSFFGEAKRTTNHR